MQQDKLRKAETEKGLHQFFKLQTTMSLSSMVLFDDKGCLRKYDSAMDILKVTKLVTHLKSWSLTTYW